MTYFNDPETGRVRRAEPVVARAARECRKNLAVVGNILNPALRRSRVAVGDFGRSVTPPVTAAEWLDVAAQFKAVEDLARATKSLAERCARETKS